MKASVAAVALLLVSVAALGITVTRKGYWTPVCSGIAISKHNRYDKALTAAINHGGNCDIIPPSRFEVVTEPDHAETMDILVSWQPPTRREDDSHIDKIDRLNLYYSFDGGVQSIIQVEATSNSYTLSDVAAGSYSFQMSTVSHGREGKKTPLVQIN